jgi:hypothetical protein
LSLVQVALWLIGVALIAIGAARIRAPWARLQALRAQDANIARYEAWRGGVRSDGKTGASVAMEFLRTQVRNAGILIAIGAALIVLGFFVSG